MYIYLKIEYMYVFRQLDTLGEENILRGLVDSQQKRGFDAMRWDNVGECNPQRIVHIKYIKHRSFLAIIKFKPETFGEKKIYKLTKHLWNDLRSMKITIVFDVYMLTRVYAFFIRLRSNVLRLFWFCVYNFFYRHYIYIM